MKRITIRVEKRQNLGKKATHEIRKNGHVPCVMYGGAEVIHFHAHENDFRNLIYSHEAFVVDLEIDGKKHNAVLQDIQFHPVSDKILHLDFVEVFEDKPVTVTLPLTLVGSSVGIKNGGKPRQRRRTLKVRGLLEHLPDHLEVDITNVDIGEVVKIGDLSYENLEVLDPVRSMIFSVVSSRVSMKGMALEEPEAEEAAGEAVQGAEAPAAEEEGEASGEETTE